MTDHPSQELQQQLFNTAYTRAEQDATGSCFAQLRRCDNLFVSNITALPGSRLSAICTYCTESSSMRNATRILLQL
jgi:hypothetical protein